MLLSSRYCPCHGLVVLGLYLLGDKVGEARHRTLTICTRAWDARAIGARQMQCSGVEKAEHCFLAILLILLEACFLVWFDWGWMLDGYPVEEIVPIH